MKYVFHLFDCPNYSSFFDWETIRFVRRDKSSLDNYSSKRVSYQVVTLNTLIADVFANATVSYIETHNEQTSNTANIYISMMTECLIYVINKGNFF